MTRRPTDITTAILAPLTFFEKRCKEKETLRKLIELANDRSRRKEAHALFYEIRRKTLAAEQSNDQVALAQYSFEEICAKTLYNLTGRPAPFDAHSPYYIVPNALTVARHVGIDDREIIRVIAGEYGGGANNYP